VQVASIVPIPFLDLVKGKPYQMCLAHLALNSKEYARFYYEEGQTGNFVLLDNGAAEHAQPSLDVLISVIEQVQPTEFILPDVLYDSEQTLDRSYRALHRLTGEDFKVRFMAVPQGNTYEEWVSCAKEMLTWPIDTIGISKFMSYKLGPCARATLFSLISTADVQMHLLGCAYDPREIAAINYMPYSHKIRGTDSSIPYVYASQGVNMYTAIKDGISRSQAEIDFYEGKTSRALISANIQIWEAIVNGELL
jgi:hypothetical protein